VTITLFLPCIAQFFVTIKERGMRTAVGMAVFILSYSLAVAGALNYALRHWNVSL
jgi:ferrous iron transport protein B